MDMRELIDAQFDRAVQIVQTLPKAGPIQTGYEEKLVMYSLYKQATVGNVQGTRPGIWDMLGRAKWDAWAKQKDVGSYEAKWRYVDQLLRVLRRYADKQQFAKDLIAELKSFAGQQQQFHNDSDSESDSEWPSNPLPLEKRHQQGEADESTLDSSYHTVDEDDDSAQPPRPPSSMSTQRYKTPTGSFLMSPPPPSSSSSAYQRLPAGIPHSSLHAQRAQSSLVYAHPSSVHHESRSQSLPMPSAHSSVANVQPMPLFETPSAFPGPSPLDSSSDALHSASGSDNTAYADPHPYPANMYPGHPAYRPSQSSHASHSRSRSQSSRARQLHNNVGAPGVLTGSVPGGGNVSIGSGAAAASSPLQKAVENLQVHLAALQERMDMLESRSFFGGIARSASGSGVFGAATGVGSVGGAGGPGGSGSIGRRAGGRISPAHPGTPYASYYSAGGRGAADRLYNNSLIPNSLWTWLLDHFDHDDVEAELGWENMGLWSVVLKPSVRVLRYLLRVFAFVFAAGSSRRSGVDAAMGGGLSPAMSVLRRLLLDASFVLIALLTCRRLWRQSGGRRREILHALMGVWSAMVGNSATTGYGGASMPMRGLIDQGV